MIVFSGCVVVPSSTPEITPTPEATPITTPTTTPEPTPAPWLAVFNKYKTKMNFENGLPWWFSCVSADTVVKINRIALYTNENTYDEKGFYQETEGVSSKKEIDKIRDKYRKIAIVNFLKRYGIEDQLIDDNQISSVMLRVDDLYVTIELLMEIVSDYDVSNIVITSLVDKNRVNVYTGLMYTKDGILIMYPPYTYDEDWNLINPEGPVYDGAGNMVYDENGKRVVSGN